LPEEYGGAGAEGLAIVVGGRAGILACRGHDRRPSSDRHLHLFLVKQGTEAQKRRWFPSILTANTIQCMGMTEPQTGSDAFRARTTAVRDGGRLRLNGSKCFISMARRPNLIYVIARTDPAIRGRNGLSMIIVPSSTPGVTQRRMKTMGYAAATRRDLLENVRVPGENLVGEEGARAHVPRIMALDRLQICARRLWCGQTALSEMTLDHVRKRRIFAQRVRRFQEHQIQLAEAEVDIDVRACVSARTS
jgi:alkylation response protein AidB-like acyl-CoA dehydrogenase